MDRFTKIGIFIRVLFIVTLLPVRRALVKLLMVYPTVSLKRNMQICNLITWYIVLDSMCNMMSVT